MVGQDRAYRFPVKLDQVRLVAVISWAQSCRQHAITSPQNSGEHLIHTGGSRASYLQLPIITPLEVGHQAPISSASRALVASSITRIAPTIFCRTRGSSGSLSNMPRKMLSRADSSHCVSSGSCNHRS